MRPVNCSLPILLLFMAVILVMGSACEKAAPPAPLAPVAVAPKKAETAAVAEDAEDKVPVFSYKVPERNPFGSLIRVKKTVEEGDGTGKDLTPLQRVTVTDMRVESIIISSNRSVAHVITPDGKAHIITVGTAMGRHKGKVVRMNSDEIVIEEQFEDYLGRAFKQETVLGLREKEGENL